MTTIDKQARPSEGAVEAMTPAQLAAAQARCEALKTTDQQGNPAILMDYSITRVACVDFPAVAAALEKAWQEIERLKAEHERERRGVVQYSGQLADVQAERDELRARVAALTAERDSARHEADTWYREAHGNAQP